ncbi:MAG: hypothetical protein IAE97_07480 [Chthoniobacterales bacterium]|nr:hypothetical protein [Chthoniobacterales bacterium]
MKKLTAEEFKALIEEDPSWASKLTEPVEITTYCGMAGSKITHLNPLLHFTGRNEYDSAAGFWGCKNLKVATGTFHGWVCFVESGIERIENLTVTKTDCDGEAASFRGCENLKVATGTYPGFVSFAESGIERIENLTVTAPEAGGYKINLCNTTVEIPLCFKPSEVIAEEDKIQRLKDRMARKILGQKATSREL